MQRSIIAFDPVTGGQLPVLTATIQPNLTQLSDAEVVAASRQELCGSIR